MYYAILHRMYYAILHQACDACGPSLFETVSNYHMQCKSQPQPQSSVECQEYGW